LIDSNK
jgi:uncharacterized protein YukE